MLCAEKEKNKALSPNNGEFNLNVSFREGLFKGDIYAGFSQTERGKSHFTQKHGICRSPVREKNLDKSEKDWWG